MKTSIVVKTGLVLLIGGAGCATGAPPQDLLTARTSYARVKNGPAATHNPADLHTAKKALEAAEKSHEDGEDVNETKNLAYIADRRAQIAEARANATQLTAKQQQTIQDMHSNTSTQLGRANEQLEAQGEKLINEREARAAADKRAAQLSADLAKFASVKEEARGMVITLSGGVLFASAKSELLAGAQVKLNSVADALTQQDPDSKVVVEGHTDSQGGMTYNQGLSERRAQSVRDYLVSRGIAADRVSSQGFGSSRSVADNKSAEGRANNRRVEIVVEPKAAGGPVSQVGK